MLITARRREFHAEEHAKENGRMMDRLRTAHVSGGREKDDKTTSIPAKRSAEAESEGGNVSKKSCPSTTNSADDELWREPFVRGKWGDESAHRLKYVTRKNERIIVVTSW